METLLLIALIVLIVGFALTIAFLVHKLSSQQKQGSVDLLKQDLVELSRGVGELKDNLQHTVSDRLDKNQAMMRDTMSKQLSESAKLITDVTNRLTKLDETNRRVVDVADELKTLQNVLQNPKQRGVLGEYYLEQILNNVLPPGAFSLQHKLADGLIVDAVIKIDDRLLPIDSKFSLENYNRLIDCKPEERPALERALKEDLKRRIDETSKYILPGKGTLDQALMFIPSEAIYYDLLANKVGLTNVSGRNLIQYAAADKKVTIVGPSTLSAMLQTIVQGIRSIEIHKDTEKIRKNIEQLSKHLIAHNGHMIKLGSALGSTVTHYNSTFKELGKIDRDIVKITDSEIHVEPLLLEKPTPTDD